MRPTHPFSSDRQTAPRSTGFSLVELLVVISIIAVLISITLPGLKQAREQARSTSCASQRKQQGMAMHTYAADFRDWLGPPLTFRPPSPTATQQQPFTYWHYLYDPYLGATMPNPMVYTQARSPLWLCPAQDVRATMPYSPSTTCYMGNRWVVGTGSSAAESDQKVYRLSDILRPSAKLLSVEQTSGTGGTKTIGVGSAIILFYFGHPNSNMNGLFADAHSENLSKTHPGMLGVAGPSFNPNPDYMNLWAPGY